MSEKRTIKNALISVFHKEGLVPIVQKLNELGINIYSTGGTQEFIEAQKISVNKVEDLTGFPSILGGRVKTLHPNVFGGILARRELDDDQIQLEKYNIPEFDLVIVDLYPFEKTVASKSSEEEIIEKIDIGGISLIRAAAKNFKDVLIISEMDQYNELLKILNINNATTSIKERKKFAAHAFNISSNYDTVIFNYFNNDIKKSFKVSINEKKELRYGENPHQSGIFYGNIDDMFTQLSGKELSYNNLLDIDAAVSLIGEFNETTFAVLKHNNTCGIASREKLIDAWKDALAGDPISAFGGVLVTNKEVNLETAKEIGRFFFDPEDPIDRASVALLFFPPAAAAARLVSMGVKGFKLAQQMKKIGQASKMADEVMGKASKPALATSVGLQLGSGMLDPELQAEVAKTGELLQSIPERLAMPPGEEVISQEMVIEDPEQGGIANIATTIRQAREMKSPTFRRGDKDHPSRRQSQTSINGSLFPF